MQGYVTVSAQVGPGYTITILKRDLEAEEDTEGFAYFDFESENSIAVSTGTLVWDASTVIIGLLDRPDHTIHAGLSLRSLISGRRVLELGSGTGLAGLCCAAAGAHMCLSDLPSIVDGILTRNIRLNTSQSRPDTPGVVPETALSLPPAHTASNRRRSSSKPAAHMPEAGGYDASTDHHAWSEACLPATMPLTATRPSSKCSPWPGAVACGAGSVTALVVDFCRPLAEQVSHGCDPRDAEVVLAADIVWLKELVVPLAATIATILKAPLPAVQNAQAAAVTLAHAAQQSSSSAQETKQAACKQPQQLTELLQGAVLPEMCQPQQPSQLAQALRVHDSQPSPGGSVSCQGWTEGQAALRDPSACQVQSKVAVMAFGERANADSKLFISLQEVRDAFRQQGCDTDIVVRQVVEREPGESMPVVVLCITASHH